MQCVCSADVIRNVRNVRNLRSEMREIWKLQMVNSAFVSAASEHLSISLQVLVAQVGAELLALRPELVGCQDEKGDFGCETRLWFLGSWN